MTTEENRKWLEEEFELHGYELWTVKPIIDVMIKDGFDMDGWTIQGQHHPQIITFQHSDGKRYFDMYEESEGDWCPYYFRPEKPGDRAMMMYKASSIAEAAEKSKWPD